MPPLDYYWDMLGDQSGFTLAMFEMGWREMDQKADAAEIHGAF